MKKNKHIKYCDRGPCKTRCFSAYNIVNKNVNQDENIFYKNYKLKYVLI